MKVQHILILVPSLFISLFLNAQNFDLKCNQLNLNQVLEQVSSTQKVEYSIDAVLANDCMFTVDTSFYSLADQLKYLASFCSLEVKRIGSVYVFKKLRTLPELPLNEGHKYLFQGLVVDANTAEPLPFAIIQIGEEVLVTNNSGYFSFKAEVEKASIKIKYLGYLIKDTVLHSGKDLLLTLNSSVTELVSFNVKANPTYSKSAGQFVGQLKFNDVSSNIVMGNSNNLIFNTMRMYPGVAASGESTSDFVIWGSYPGQNRIEFDGVTLFNSRGVNDEISRVNAFLVKDIELYKGAYNVDVGEGVGGVMVINGKKGNHDSLNIDMLLSNNAGNAYLNIPFKKIKSNLQIASRISLFNGLNSAFQKNTTEYYYPNYNFNDFNLKLNTEISNKDFLQFTFLNSSDNYTESAAKSGKEVYERNVEITSKQSGGSLQYQKLWSHGGISSFVASFSSFTPDYTSENRIGINNLETDYHYYNNRIEENSIKLNYQFPANKWYSLLTGISYVENASELVLKNNETYLNQSNRNLRRVVAYAKNDIKLGSLVIHPGLRMDLTLNDLTPNLQPRLNTEFKIHQNLHLNFGWGWYRQFVTKSLLTDNYNQRSYFWQISNEISAPVTRSEQSAIGLTYNKNRLEITSEFFYKTINNINRYFIEDSASGLTHSIGEARIYGVDILLRLHFHKFEFLTSYSLGRSLERFEQSSNIAFYDAPQSQQHEGKVGFIYRTKKLRFSVSQVIGSGFTNSNANESVRMYSRSDVGMEYDLITRKIDVDLGFSILNVMNRKNNRLNHYASFPDGTQAIAAGIPFTPSINLMCKF